MKDSAYLTVNANGIIRMTKNPPHLRAGEYAVKVCLSVPQEYFKAVIPVANINVNGRHLHHPPFDVQIEDAPIPQPPGEAR